MIVESEFNKELLSKKAWVAYVFPVITLGFVGELIAINISLWLIPIPIILLLLNVLSLRSIELYLDNEGIWISSGIFPWTKGRNGIRWEDTEQGYYHQGFFSWMTSSYKVLVMNRFTSEKVFEISHMKGGKDAMSTINRTLERTR
ncbi:hypothetical protein ACROAE_06185 [Shewanella sp. MF05960]|uniref:hypothetical protein n=1 Tax=Shewanella sp. MF05960 TaxID=3434874 RepID=UPI003D7979F5